MVWKFWHIGSCRPKNIKNRLYFLVAKLAIATELDIDPEELKVGRQRFKARVGQIEVDTEQIFMETVQVTRWASKPRNFRKAIENFIQN